eukprot:g258.t1
MTSQAVYMTVIKQLKEEFNGLYSEANVAIAASHTHTGPGGYSQYFLYSLATGGFSNETFTAQVEGILTAIRAAHSSAQSGSIRIARGELDEVGVNRSPTAYLNNPKEERDQYPAQVDKTMTLLRFTLDNGDDLGALNWFPVHGTSLNNSITLISGDNKGIAAQLFEKSFKQKTNADFVAAFAQENSGDVSPNTQGSYCLDSGLSCTESTSSCHGRNELCHGRGPGWPDSFKSNYIIGEKQYKKAIDLFHLAWTLPELDSIIDYRSLFLDLSSVMFLDKVDSHKTTCKPAMGYSFAAGTTDGPGAFDFVQGSTKSSRFWDVISGLLLKHPSTHQKRCQAPKPILLDTGEMHKPSPWQPVIVPLQVLRIGRLFILCFPGEITTMAGRRLRESVKKVLSSHIDNVEVVISGLTNTYASYVTTLEEYQIQRYEGASTIYGPHTLSAYQKEFTQLATDIIDGTVRSTEFIPPEFNPRESWLIRNSSIVDRRPFMKTFGQLYKDVEIKCATPGDIVEAQFWASNPRNSLWLTDHTFLAVEMYNKGTKQWDVIFIDDDLSTKFIYSHRRIRFWIYSIATISWSVPTENTTPGVYRLRYSGHFKCGNSLDPVCGFYGLSSSFTISTRCKGRPHFETIVY